MTALFVALMAVISPIAIPVGNMPVTLTTLVISFGGAYIGSASAVLAVAVYLVLGIIGIPVFSGFTAGIGHLVGPTGGFLLGYIPFALICGFARKRTVFFRVIVFVSAALMLYAIGTVWYIFWADVSLPAALLACVVPVLPGDALKIIVAAVITGKAGKGNAYIP